MRLPAPHRPMPRSVRRAGRLVPGERELVEEMAVALCYNGTTHAVMMATPVDLEDFAVGFTLTEDIAGPDRLESVDVVPRPDGVEIQISMDGAADETLKARRRAMAGPVGCGLCGIESLAQAARPVGYASAEPPASSRCPLSVPAAMEALRAAQPLHDATRSAHAAGFHHFDRGLICVREDVGRHNALDKLVGALSRDGENPAEGAILLTSRVSIEMAQKTVIAGSRVLVAASAPTASAVAVARDAGLTLVAAARGRDYEIYAHSERLTEGVDAHVE